MEKLRNLPVGQQYFRSIIESNAIYVDKTRYIYEICAPLDKNYFLSRPRRFGKSLTLDTIAELFSGSKALFEGLWIADKWDWSQTFPIIRLSLDTIGQSNGLAEGLKGLLFDIAKNFNVKLNKQDVGELFKELIATVAITTGKKVVILIDEYDRPIIDHIDVYDLTKAEAQRDILKSFFAILKNSSNHIRFLFITGVSKFAQTSIFSDLNHLSDLTLNKKYAALCGYTQEELEYYFAEYLKKLPPDTLQKMKVYYNGYSWDGKTFLYNPFSVLNFFDTEEYRNFWFSTGTPTFLIKLLYKRFEYTLEAVEVESYILDTFQLKELDFLDVNSLLLQTGYLTIKEKTAYGTFILDYPNQEVRTAFGQFLLGEYTQTPNTLPHSADILRALDQNNLERVIQVINNLIKSVPDQNYIKEQEKFFHAIIHLIFTIAGSDPRSELHTNIGRIDTVIIRAHRIFLFEFKLNETPQAAIQSIKDRKYPDSLRVFNKPITGIGIVFSVEKKGIDDWAAEEL
jgi:hypothetical protein